MKAKAEKVEEHDSQYGKKFFYVFFRDEAGKTARTCVYPQFRNYARWKKVIDDVKFGREVWLRGLNWKNKEEKMIDADSLIERIPTTV